MIYLGKKGLTETFQDDFPKETECCRCKGSARIAFVYAEDGSEKKFICDLYKGKVNKLWLHDCCAVAIYFCEKCLEPTALYNQA